MQPFFTTATWAFSALLLAAAADEAMTQQHRTATPRAPEPHATSWQSLLESHIRVAYRYTHAPKDPRSECALSEDLPHSVYLASAYNMVGERIGHTWRPSEYASRWEPVGGPSRADTLRMGVAGLWCQSDGATLLLEHDGYYLEVDGGRFAQIDTEGNLHPGLILIENAQGALDHAAIRMECGEGRCRYAVVPATPYTSQLQVALAQRLAEERRQMEERQRQEEERRRLEEERLRQERLAIERAEADQRAAAERERRQRIVQVQQRYGVSADAAIAFLNGRVATGMTEPMVRQLLGAPQRESREVTPTGTVVTWHYPRQRVEFSGGRVHRLY